MSGQPGRGRGRGGMSVRPPVPSSSSGGDPSRKRQGSGQPGPSSFARNTRPRSDDSSAGGSRGYGAVPGQPHGLIGGGGGGPSGPVDASRGSGGMPHWGGGAQARGRGQGAARGGRGRGSGAGCPPPFRPPATVPSGFGPPGQAAMFGAAVAMTRPTARPPPLALTPPPVPPKAKPVRKADSETPPPFPDPALVNNLVVAYEDSLRRPASTSHPNPPKKRAPQVTYEYAPADPAEPTLVKCTIRLPPESNAICKVFVSAPAEKTAARKLAAAAVMHELWRAGEVDNSYRTGSHASAPPPPKLVGPGTNAFPVKTPEFYDACEAILNTGAVERSRIWHPTLVTLPPLPADPAEPNAPPPKPLRPLLMLTPLLLPTFSALTPLKLFQPHSTTASPVALTALPPVALSTAEHAMADHYTRRLLRAVLNRSLLLEEGRLLVHLFLPPTATHEGVDWDEVQEAQGEAYEPWQWRDLEAFKKQAADSMTTGKNEFSRRFEVQAVRPDLTPLSSPDDSPREKDFSSILEYIRSTSSQEVYLSSESQPLLEMNKVPAVKSHLRSILSNVPEELPENAPPRKVVHDQKYIIPDLSFRSTLRFSTFRSALYLPSFLTQLSILLTIFELKTGLLGGTMREDLLLRSLTTPAAHREEDYDELEYSGDVVLKCMASAYLYVMHPKASEGELSRRRVSLVNNKFLMTRLVESGLTHCLLASEHTPRTWYPHNMGRWDTSGSSQNKNLNEEAVRDSKMILVGDKACADVIEALIYAAYETGGLPAAWTFCRVVKLPMPEISAWTDFAKLPVWLTKVDYPQSVIEASADISRLLQYEFHNAQLLRAALMREAGNQSNFQRLEYLGDAVLDLLAIDYLHERIPTASVGQMVLFKSNIVSNVALSALCVDISLHKVLSQEGPTVWPAVERYARDVTKAKAEELKAAAEEKRPHKVYWAHLDAPKAVGDLIEAVIGALMVDGGYSAVEPRQHFFDAVFKPFLIKFMSGMHSLPEQPAGILVKLVAARRCTGFEIRKPPRHAAGGNAKQQKVKVLLHKVVLAEAVADTENFAMRSACSQALHAIEADPGLLARLCNCTR